MVIIISLLLLLWYHSESNQGHTDFQSVALPAELWYPVFVFFEGAKIRWFFELTSEKIIFSFF